MILYLQLKPKLGRVRLTGCGLDIAALKSPKRIFDLLALTFTGHHQFPIETQDGYCAVQLNP